MFAYIEKKVHNRSIDRERNRQKEEEEGENRRED
jgi:hypothetical protein